MKTVMVNPSVYKLSQQATEAFKTIHDEWELDVGEKNPYDWLEVGKKPVHKFQKHNMLPKCQPIITKNYN